MGLLSVALISVLVGIGGEVVEGDTAAFDMAMLRTAQSVRTGSPWVAEVMRDVSELGSTVVMALFILVTVGYLGVVKLRPAALLVAAAFIAGSLAVSLLKTLFGRTRPDPVLAQVVAPGMSFPSGQVAMSAIVFLTVGALLASTRSRALEQVYILAMSTLMTVLVGTGRVALGVHWATDVLAGWALGAPWALLWLLFARRLMRMGRREPRGPVER